MPETSEKRFSIGGFQVSVTADAARMERIRNSGLYRRVLRPGLGLVRRGKNGHNGHNRAGLTLAPAPAPPDLRDAKTAATWERVSKTRWYHTIDLGNGIVTPGFIDNRDTVHRFGLPEDLTGMRCLDIGTYDGFWAFEMERRGASDVIGIDVDSPADYDLPRKVQKLALEGANHQEDSLKDTWNTQMSEVGMQLPGEGFRLAKEILGSNVRREALNVYDLAPEKVGMFDLVLISQLLLRLRDPQTVMENMFSVTRGVAIVAESYDPELERYDVPLSRFVGTEVLGSWWQHSIKSMRKMMEVAGFERIEEVDRFVARNRAGTFSKVILKGYAPGAASN